ncbi:hypothetical protein LXA43DRAFT_341555 [Ganoderma leucocontextum]|nr:hypothetical protein LXA43DRAFT_341555 [Ganoderma leucocontextum]
MRTFQPPQISRIDEGARFVQSPLLGSQAATNYNYLAVSHSDNFCSTKAHASHPKHPAIAFKLSGDKTFPGALRRTSSLSTLAFADDTFHASVPGIDSSPSLKFPPGLWSEDVDSFPFGPQSTTQSDFLDLSESFSSLAARSTSEPVVAGSSPSSASYASALDLQSNVHTGNYSLSTLTFLGTLGRGGYGKVLLAQSSHTGNDPLQLAVKVLAKRRMTLDDVQEVKMEVQLLRALSLTKGDAVGTAFLQRMHGAFQTKEHVFIIMVRHTANLVSMINLNICASFRNDTAQPCQILLSNVSSACVPLPVW